MFDTDDAAVGRRVHEFAGRRRTEHDADMVLRVKDPGRPRPFKVPFVWFVAPAGMAACAFFMYSLPKMAWERFAWWLVIGLVLYFAYGYQNSKLRKGH